MPKLKAGQRCHCGCGKRAAAVFFKNGHYFGSWACANTAQRLATEPHDTAPDGSIRFRYLPTVADLRARGFQRLLTKRVSGEVDHAERWLMPAECKGGKRGRFYIDRFRGLLIAVRTYVCYSKDDFEAFLSALAGVGTYAPLHAARCVPRPRKNRAATSAEPESIVLAPEVLALVREHMLKRTISTTLSVLAQRGTLIKFKKVDPSVKGHRVLYGMPDWLDADGRPQPQHREQLKGYKRI